MSIIKRWIQLSALLLAVVGSSSVARADDFLHAYAGELINPDGSTIAGVWALTYKLYAEQGASTPLWEELHYVGVVEGEYEIELGNSNPLDAELEAESLWLGVEFQGGELLREPIELVPIEDEPAFARTTPSPYPVRGSTNPTGDDVTVVTFAHQADRALLAQEAERCRDADRLGGRTLRDIDRYDEVLDLVAEHISDGAAHSGGGGVGRSNTVLPRVGGAGGVRFTSMCPTGYIMVGLRGGAGQMVDSIEIVCAPLE